MNSHLDRQRLGQALAAAAIMVGAESFAAGQDDRSTSPPNVVDDTTLLQGLRRGGHVVYFRHGRTDLSTHDSDRDNLANCATQRALSAEGRRQMSEIGTAFRRLRIPVGTVLSSPYCRAIDTAKLAFGRATIDASLEHTITADAATAKRRGSALAALLAGEPAAGTNTVIAGHTGNLQEAVGIWPSPEGVAIVFKPDGRGGTRYLATVAPERWAEWAKRETARPPPPRR